MTGRHDEHFGNAILAVDAVGYSRLMGKDEEATLRRLHRYRALIKNLVDRNGGSVFGVAGDSEMALFPTASQAVCGALQIQDSIEKENAVLPKDSRMPVRIGLSFGRVRVEDDGVFGDAVNIAARIENFAQAGEVCVSDSIFEQVKNDRVWGFDCFGEERFKNIAHPVRVYRVRTDPEAIGQVIPVRRRQPRPGRIWRAAVVALLVVLLGATFWGTKLEVDKKRAKATTAKVITDAQNSAAKLEAQIEQLVEDLHQAESRTAEERGRVEALVASLQEARDRANRSEQAALARTAKTQDVLALLQAAEARAEAERKRNEALLAALEQVEKRVAARQTNAGLERQASAADEHQFADQALVDSLLTSWRAAERQAAEERSRADALLLALKDAEALAEAERQARLNQQDNEALLARLDQAYVLAVEERRRAKELYKRVQEAQEVALQGDVQQLAGEATRIESLLASLSLAETQIIAERKSVAVLLETLRQADPPAPPDTGPDSDGEDPQVARSHTIERAKTLLASWAEAEHEAAGKRQRAEGLLTVFETTPVPPVPPPKPHFKTSHAGLSPRATVLAVRPNLVSDQSKMGPPPAAPAPSQIASGETQLAHDRFDKVQVYATDSSTLTMPSATGPSDPPVDIEALNGIWIGERSPWSLKLTVRGRVFSLTASCDSDPGSIHDTVLGKLDDQGKIYALILPHSYKKAVIWGVPERLEIMPHHKCGTHIAVGLARVE